MLAPGRLQPNDPIAVGGPPEGLAVAFMTLVTTSAIALAAGTALHRYPPPSVGLVIVAGIGMLALLLLVLTRYDFAVGLAFVCLGVVKFEPAPVDLLFAVLILVAVVTGRLNLRRIPLAPAGGLALFVLFNIVSMVDAVDPGQAAFFFALTLYGAMLTIWLAGYVDSERRARIVVLCYLAAAVGSTVIGILALIAPIPGGEDLLYAGERIQGFFKDPNVYAPFLIPVALILLEEMITPRILRMRRWLTGVMFGLLVFGVILAGSRAAWVSLGIGVVVVLAILSLRQGGGQHAFAAFSIVILGIFAATAIILATDTTNLLGERATVQAYDAGRFETQAEGINLAQEHPVGLGPGQFDVYSPLAIHSLYLRSLVEQGILGMAALLVFVIGTLVLAFRNAVVGRGTMGIGSAALLGAWVGMMVNSVVIDSMHWRHFWVVAGLVWAGYMHASTRQADSRQRPVA